MLCDSVLVNTTDRHLTSNIVASGVSLDCIGYEIFFMLLYVYGIKMI